jgi:hypothetical protein
VVFLEECWDFSTVFGLDFEIKFCKRIFSSVLGLDFETKFCKNSEFVALWREFEIENLCFISGKFL